jgi:cyclopropane fatty-acyl-phospholipid synthase-like methyltransferase
VNPNKALWEKGDFPRLAESMRKSGASLVKGLGISPGLKVLDLGCGDGTTALPEATRGADVLGRRAGRRYRQQSGRGREQARLCSRLDQLQVSAGRCLQSSRAPG